MELDELAARIELCRVHALVHVGDELLARIGAPDVDGVRMTHDRLVHDVRPHSAHLRRAALDAHAVDIGAGNGTNILAAASGTVIVSTYNSAYGNYVVIDHGGGMSTLYAHMSKRLVGVGDTVTVGEVIGLVGSTGLSTGPHLHFEVRINGQHTKPNPYLGI